MMGDGEKTSHKFNIIIFTSFFVLQFWRQFFLPVIPFSFRCASSIQNGRLQLSFLHHSFQVWIPFSCSKLNHPQVLNMFPFLRVQREERRERGFHGTCIDFSACLLQELLSNFLQLVLSSLYFSYSFSLLFHFVFCNLCDGNLIF